MYYQGSGLGFSLLPPKSVRTAFANIFGKAVGATERAAAAKLDTIAPAPAPSPMALVQQAVPGGWGTIAAVGAGVVALVLLMGRRR